jgi:signal transduction histidine kinase
VKRRTVWSVFWSWAGRVPLRQKIIGIIVAPLLILGFTIAWWVSSQLGGWLSYLLTEERVVQAMAVGMRSVFIITIFAAIAGLGIGLFLTWLLTRPILDMTFVARRVKNGDLSVRAPVWANDEIGELGRAFNDMISSLSASRQELERFNQQLNHRNLELAVLYTLADMANQPYSMRQVSEHSLEHILENTGADAGLILICSDHQPRITASQQLPESFLEQTLDCLPNFTFPPEQGLELGAPLVIDDVHNTNETPTALILASRKLDYRTLVLAPIVAKNTMLGILVIAYANSAPLTQQHRQLLCGICNQLGMTIQNSQLWEQLKHKEQLRAQLLNKVVSAQEEERQRISRELHDETGQALTSLLVQLKILERSGNLTEVRTQVEHIRQVVARTLQEVRRLAADLRPSALDDLGLIPALEGYIYNYASKTGIHVDFEAHGVEDIRLLYDVEIVLYRVIQESLTNIARHASATEATVTIRREQDRIDLSIRDNGCGFDTANVFNGGDRGLGILGMQERIQLLGGRFECDSAPGAGTRIHVELSIAESMA